MPTDAMALQRKRQVASADVLCSLVQCSFWQGKDFGCGTYRCWPNTVTVLNGHSLKATFEIHFPPHRRIHPSDLIRGIYVWADDGYRGNSQLLKAQRISVSWVTQPQTGRLHHASSPRLRSQRQGGGEIVRASEEEGGTEDVSGHHREAESVYSQQLWLLHKFKPDSLLEQRGRDSWATTHAWGATDKWQTAAGRRGVYSLRVLFLVGQPQWSVYIKVYVDNSSGSWWVIKNQIKKTPQNWGGERVTGEIQW